MSYYHPLWEPPDAGTLQKGWEAVQKAKSLGAKTQRERDYIDAIEVFYKDFDKLDHRTRALAYEKAMEQLYRRYPEDREAAILYALAMRATALETDKSYTKQKRSSEILEKIFKEQPEHPGLAHYIIHCNDYPSLASHGLDAARRYAKIAPSSPHALHMPSHIFTRLGYWDESITSNRASEAAAKEFALENFKDATWDQQLHAMDYLMYAYLQSARDKEAKTVLDEANSIRKLQPENLTAAYALAAMPARYAIERRQWTEASSLTLSPADFPWSRYPIAGAIQYFARTVGAARGGDLEGARTNLEKIESFRSASAGGKGNYDWAGQVEILRREAAAWVAYAEGKNDNAMKLMRSAASLEDSTDKHPVTPGPIVPAHELLADLLLEMRKPAQALQEFETSLESSPNRFNAMYGAARAAELTGDKSKAAELYGKLIEVCKNADGQRMELKEAKAFLAKK